jgi:hypothetical protein
MTQTETSPQEQVLQQGPLSTLQAGMWKRGVAVLTTERFYRKTKGFAILSLSLGYLGRSINQLFPEKHDIDISLTSITLLGRGKLGLLKDVLYIETVDGKSYQLTPGYESWLTALRDALQSHTHATLAQSGDDRWTVQR